MSPLGPLLGQIGLPAPKVGAAMALLVGSAVAFLLGLTLLIVGWRRRADRRWIWAVGGLALTVSAVVLWGWIGILGRPIRKALHGMFPTRRSWDLSTGHETARLGEGDRLPGLKAFGGDLDFTIHLPHKRQLAGRAKYIGVASDGGLVRRLNWRSSPTAEPCAVAETLLASLALSAAGRPCRPPVARPSVADLLSEGWVVESPPAEEPHVALHIVESYGAARGTSLPWTVEVNVVWDERR